MIPAPSLDLAKELGRAIAKATDTTRIATLARIYSNMTPEAKARCDQARAWFTLERNA